MNTHTPGPWTAYNSHGGTIYRSWRIGESNTTPGVTCPIATIANEDTGRTGDEQVANARLIEAAPDLLAALQEAERVIRWAAQESTGRVRAELVGGWLHHANKIGQTIAQATK